MYGPRGKWDYIFLFRFHIRRLSKCWARRLFLLCGSSLLLFSTENSSLRNCKWSRTCLRDDFAMWCDIHGYSDMGTSVLEHLYCKWKTWSNKFSNKNEFCSRYLWMVTWHLKVYRLIFDLRLNRFWQNVTAKC